MSLLNECINFMGRRGNKDEREERKREGEKEGNRHCFHFKQNLLDKNNVFLEQSRKRPGEERPTQPYGRYCGKVTE